ncbi:hypothetical protein FSARC_9057 [Fusarium sarcochroum]|uniref:Uncharacterized protein n=1 Tax=Fusarium sarcochroum TaxID=1208366 RepID=A0A8H4TRP7_9HYPO|nr:hypothetical protein FSARC_9057 [Fusarium sarcochroum]
MDPHSYLPFSFTRLSWPPIRRSPNVDDSPWEDHHTSKADRIVTTGIVCGIAALFAIPVVWYLIARCIRAKRSRAKAKDAEQGVEMVQNTMPTKNSNENGYSLLYISPSLTRLTSNSPNSPMAPFTIHQRTPIPETYSLPLLITLISIPCLSFIFVLILTMSRSPWQKIPSDEESTLERGMLVEVVRIHKDGKQVYSRDSAPMDKRLYDHPSFVTEQKFVPETEKSEEPVETNKKPQIKTNTGLSAKPGKSLLDALDMDDFEDIPLSPKPEQKPIRELRAELAEGMYEVEQDWYKK